MNRKMNDIDNTKLIESMQAYIDKPSKEALIRLVLALKDTEVFVPVMVNQDKQALQPYIIKNKDGDMYVPAFTSMERFPKGQKYQGMQKLQYKQCVSMLLGNKASVQGIVLNPYTDNLILKEQMLELSNKMEQDLPKKQKMTIKINDFRMIARYDVEFRQIPKRLHTQKLAFIQELSAEKLCEIYKEPYAEVKQERLYEYTADDFEIMELDVREDLNVMQIMLPSKYLYQTNCREMYVVWNPQTERVGCYVVEKAKETPEKKAFLLKEIKQDGSWGNFEEAPSEGNIMNRVMELFEAAKEE